MRIEPLADTPMNRRLATGHRARLGHELQAVQVTEDGILWHTVDQCCGEQIPETVETWAEHVPDKP